MDKNLDEEATDEQLDELASKIKSTAADAADYSQDAAKMMEDFQTAAANLEKNSEMAQQAKRKALKDRLEARRKAKAGGDVTDTKEEEFLDQGVEKLDSKKDQVA